MISFKEICCDTEDDVDCDTEDDVIHMQIHLDHLVETGIISDIVDIVILDYYQLALSKV